MTTGKHLTTLEGFRETYGGCVASIGKFDGVHRGHLQIVRQLNAKARQYGVPSLVIVIEPHPEEFFAADVRDCPPRLSEASEKVALLQAAGADLVYLLRFDEALCHLSPEAYVSDILVQALNVKSLIIGNDFRFGHQRRGDYALLQRMGEQNGFSVVETESVMLGTQRISSTFIRECLAAADFDTVTQALGRPYSITGRVMKGRQLGRQLGFPTANLALNRRNIPLHGVYACQCRLTLPVTNNGKAESGAEGEASCHAHTATELKAENKEVTVNGVANIGYRPTVEKQGEAMLEVHLLDFDQDIYEADMSVTFCHRIRSEQKFDSLEQLQTQIAHDIQAAKAWFATQSSHAVSEPKSEVK